MESRTQLKDSMCRYLWPLSRRMALPNYSIWRSLYLPQLTQERQRSACKQKPPCCLGARSWISTFHSGISHWTECHSFVDVPAKTLLNIKLRVSQRDCLLNQSMEAPKTPLLKYCQLPALILTLMLSVEIKPGS